MAKKPAPGAAKATVTVVQIGSPIGRQAVQLQTLKGLGLNKAAPHPRARGYARGARHDPPRAPSGPHRGAGLTGWRTRRFDGLTDAPPAWRGGPRGEWL